MFKCPNCGSDNTQKEYYLGSDTMDRKCLDCDYEGPATEFRIDTYTKKDIDISKDDTENKEKE